MGACCSNSAKGAVAQPARPRQGQPVMLGQSSAANNTRAEQLKAQGQQMSQAAAQGISEEEFLQRVGTNTREGDTCELKVLTCNLCWSENYGTRGGDAGLPSKVISSALPDLFACQDCEDITRVLYEGSMQDSYRAIRGPHSLGMAYKTGVFELLQRGFADVAIDEKEQFHGSRGVAWARFTHKPSGKVVFFMNHHGPLRVNSGGRMGAPVTAQNIVKVIYDSVQPGDDVILVGDFNAQVGSQTIREIERYLPRTSPSAISDGVDHFFSTQPMLAEENLGSGGSVHNALTATFLI